MEGKLHERSNDQKTDRNRPLSCGLSQSLYRLVSCLDVGSVAQEEVAHSIITTSANIARFQRRINHSFSTDFSDECAALPEPVEPTHDAMPLSEDSALR